MNELWFKSTLAFLFLLSLVIFLDIIANLQAFYRRHKEAENAGNHNQQKQHCGNDIYGSILDGNTHSDRPRAKHCDKRNNHSDNARLVGS